MIQMALYAVVEVNGLQLGFWYKEALVYQGK